MCVSGYGGRDMHRDVMLVYIEQKYTLYVMLYNLYLRMFVIWGIW